MMYSCSDVFFFLSFKDIVVKETNLQSYFFPAILLSIMCTKVFIYEPENEKCILLEED